MDKVVGSAAEAVADVVDGASLAVGGFGVCGVPILLIAALAERRLQGLSAVSNNCGLNEFGLGMLLLRHQIARMTASYVGENSEFARQYLSGELEVELVPQGTLAERLRAGGFGIPAFFTPTGVGTQVAEGGLPWRYAPDGSVALASPRRSHGSSTVARTSWKRRSPVTTPSSGARVADRFGNLVFHESARNFNPLCASAGRVTIVEAEEIVEPGEIDPDAVHLAGVFVQRIVQVPPGTEKMIEKRTVRPRAGAVA